MNEQIKNWYKDKKRLMRYLLLVILAIASVLAPWTGKPEAGNVLFWAWLIILYEEAEFFLAKRNSGKYRLWQVRLLAFLFAAVVSLVYLVYNFLVAR